MKHLSVKKVLTCLQFVLIFWIGCCFNWSNKLVIAALTGYERYIDDGSKDNCLICKWPLNMYIINAYLLFILHLPPNKYNQTRSLLFFKETKTSHIFVEKNLRMQKVSILKSKNSNLNKCIRCNMCNAKLF